MPVPNAAESSSPAATAAVERKPKKETRIQSAARAVNLLALVASGQTNNSGKELAAAAGLAVPTAHHLLATLVAEGFLAQDERARYLLGPKVAVLAHAYQRELTPPSYLLSPLHRLVSSTGETAYLATWRRGEIHLLAGIEGHHPVRVTTPTTGRYEDAHARASGKLFLAFLGEEERDAYLTAHSLRKRTAHTITSRRRLSEELKRTRERGYALDEEELDVGICCISAPVLEDGVLVAAYSMSVPTQRYRERCEQLVAATLATAATAAASARSPNGAADGANGRGGGSA